MEELAERGHVIAMRYVACGYLTGITRFVEKTATGKKTSVKPDFEKARHWAIKAEQAGDPIAAKMRPPA